MTSGRQTSPERPMNSTGWQEIKSIVQDALDMPLEQRTLFVAQRCGVDRSLSDEVIALLDTEQSLGDFISKPACIRFLDTDSSDDIYELHVGDRLGRYEIIGEIGRGGMGAVYLALDGELNRKVALKILPAGIYRHPDGAKRFRREARIISALNHPNVITIHEIGQIESIDFIATEYVEGITLRQRIVQGNVTIREVIDIAMQVMAALTAAHAAGFIHRDIKPENIIIRSDGLVKVLDFGIAKLTGSPDSPALNLPPESSGLSLSAGTPKYMSPEQLRGDKLDQRSDIWSFGAVLFEMLVGDAPKEDRVEVLARWRDPASRSLAQENLRRLINKCLEELLEDRYASAGEVLAELKYINDELTAGRDRRASRLISSEARYIVGALLILLALITGAVVYSGRLAGKDAHVSEIRNLAVMPAESVASATGEDYLADGLTDGLISDLSQIADLRVISRTSVMRYKDKHAALPVVAQELNVEAVVVSTIQRSGEVVRLSVRLVHATSGRPIWEKGYERSQTQLPALMKEITRDIAREISIKLTPGESALLSNSRPVDANAYEEYLKGRFFLNKRNEESLNQAILHFKSSIERDPDFALSYAFLSDAYFALGTEIVAALPPVEALEMGRVAAEKAVELDESLAEAQVSLGVIKLYTWQWGEAETNLRRAVELNPNYAAAHSWYALYFVSQGRVGEAIARMYKARDLDPVSPHITQNVGWMLHYAGQHQEEIEQYKRALELDPDFLFARRRLAGAYRQIGQIDAAIAECEKVIATSGRKPMSLFPLAQSYARSGRKDAAEQILQELLSMKETRHVSAYQMASLYAALGDKKSAFERLEKAYQEKSYALVFLKVTKDFDENFRRDPRFVDLLRRLNL
jgi:eukaryotic-like serine/threonine-protein kinase